MDTQTRHALKGDKFAQATKTSVSWVSGHRSGVVRWAVSIVAAVVLLGIGAADFLERALVGCRYRPGRGDGYLLFAPGRARRSAGRRYLSPPPADRSKAANQQFVAVAQKYGWLPEGAKAHYFAGVTDEDLGQNGRGRDGAESGCGSWDHNLANLAKLALAGLYHQTSRDPQAIDLYNADHRQAVGDGFGGRGAAWTWPTCMPPTGKQDQARALWAKVKDADKDGAAGSIAAQKAGRRRTIEQFWIRSSPVSWTARLEHFAGACVC